MSLTEALLLDLEPFELWAALRSDGRASSGTAEEPYDGSPIKPAPLGADSSSAADFAPGYWGRIWDVGWWLIEGNIIELSNRKLNTDFNRAVGVVNYIGGFPPQDIIRQAVIRDNVIRQFQNRSDPATLIYSHAMELFGWPLSGIGAGLLQRNVATLDNVSNVSLSAVPAPIEYLDVNLSTFDNRSAAALLIPAVRRVVFNPTAAELISQITAGIDDAQASAFLF